jgi:hypothetical protein
MATIGDGRPDNSPGDLSALTNAFRDARLAKQGSGSQDRLVDAFKQLKDMHKEDPATPMQAPNVPNALDNAQWPFGPIGAPSQAQASAPQAHAPIVPTPMPRPADAPQPPQAQAQGNPFADFFKRNTAMMQDPNGGGYIDPQAAAQAGPGILSHLFG